MSAERLAELIRTSQPCVALTGAGASTDSGIPDFRSRTGIWATVDPREVASLSAFRDDPEREEKTADAVSLAWEALQTAPPEATAWTIAEFAVKGVRQGRHFTRSRRSIDSPLRAKDGKRMRFDPAAATRPSRQWVLSCNGPARRARRTPATRWS